MKYNQQAYVVALLLGASQAVKLEKHHHHRHKDIGQKKIDERVWGFASADTNNLPEPRPRTNVAYPTNGVFNPSW